MPGLKGAKFVYERLTLICTCGDGGGVCGAVCCAAAHRFGGRPGRLPGQLVQRPPAGEQRPPACEGAGAAGTAPPHAVVLKPAGPSKGTRHRA